MLYDNILQTMGNIPTIKLNNLAGSDAADIYLKLDLRSKKVKRWNFKQN
ncbi:hypothetical protein [Geosporobacter ferrireducens]|nr:hypothetical protein [Geosporobacter ferrireducens]